MSLTNLWDSFEVLGTNFEVLCTHTMLWLLLESLSIIPTAAMCKLFVHKFVMVVVMEFYSEFPRCYEYMQVLVFFVVVVVVVVVICCLFFA